VLLGRFDPSRSAEPLPESASSITKQLELLNQTLSQWVMPAPGSVREGTLSAKAGVPKP
jgi:hypothetical protein